MESIRKLHMAMSTKGTYPPYTEFRHHAHWLNLLTAYCMAAKLQNCALGRMHECTHSSVTGYMGTKNLDV